MSLHDLFEAEHPINVDSVPARGYPVHKMLQLLTREILRLASIGRQLHGRGDHRHGSELMQRPFVAQDPSHAETPSRGYGFERVQQGDCPDQLEDAVNTVREEPTNLVGNRPIVYHYIIGPISF